MQFSKPSERRPTRETTVPMINVVFLLLIFFMMSAQIAPPEPFEVVLPSATQQGKSEGQPALYLSSEGELAFRSRRGDEALRAARADVAERGAQTAEIRADSGVDARYVAHLLPWVAEVGIRSVALVTVAK